MGAQDQQLFIDAVARARAGGHVNFIGDPYSSSESWVSALFACNRMAMFDILPALKAINPEGKDDIEFLTVVEDNRKTLGGGTDRIKFAYAVVTRREIEDRGQPVSKTVFDEYLQLLLAVPRGRCKPAVGEI